MNFFQKRNKIPFYLQCSMYIFLVSLSIILIVLLTQETYQLIEIITTRQPQHQGDNFIEIIINYFLYFEFIALIVKYFYSNGHFPLQYFIYISITATLRLIIVDHSHAFNTLLYSLAILIQVIAFKLCK